MFSTVVLELARVVDVRAVSGDASTRRETWVLELARTVDVRNGKRPLSKPTLIDRAETCPNG